MTRRACVNYHVHKPYRQSFEIDAGGIPGKLVSPDLARTEIEIHDIRLGEAAVSFERDGVEFKLAPSRVRVTQKHSHWHHEYEAELAALLTQELRVQEIEIFDHTVRIDDPNSDRRPARNVHSDYSNDGAHQRLIDLLGQERASEWSDGHFAFINIWRPVEHTVMTAPLAFAKPSSVEDKDWILLDLIYPDRRGQIMGLAANPAHQWIYHSKMTPDHAVFFNIFDNCGRPSVGHSAVDLVEDQAFDAVRTSVESRTLVRF
ncbi:MAG: CmcJ/NvfI family oxidoreductase [Pseudomonadota bacterium]